MWYWSLSQRVRPQEYEKVLNKNATFGGELDPLGPVTEASSF
jgi:hypothetical protein